LSEGILELTLEGEIVYANTMAIFLSGISEKKLLVSDFTGLFHETDRKRIKNLLKVIDDVPQTIVA